MIDELLGRQSAFDEAKALYRMIGDENTIEELRDLIAVPTKIQKGTASLRQKADTKGTAQRALHNLPKNHLWAVSAAVASHQIRGGASVGATG
jgi:hypothetical protein